MSQPPNPKLFCGEPLPLQFKLPQIKTSSFTDLSWNSNSGPPATFVTPPCKVALIVVLAKVYSAFPATLIATKVLSGLATTCVVGDTELTKSKPLPGPDQ